ncbi:hypothetical protein ABIB25_002921 [Nakamurella sp. UYEF19]|uniref:hypothetical protein n=1 Tax=Nakamurella sp. UYEF19 TaxID=1756392 RepID=UPI003393B8BD
MRRVLLLAALMVGLLSLYLLSAHDGRAGHRMVAQAASVSAYVAVAGPAVPTPAVADPSADGVTDRPALEMCALLMLAAAGVGLLGQRCPTDSATDSPAARRALLGVLRGPPSPTSRLVLCVERI